MGVFRALGMAARRWYLLVPLMLVAAAVAWLVYRQMPATYTATVVHQVTIPPDSSASGSAGSAGSAGSSSSGGSGGSGGAGGEDNAAGSGSAVANASALAAELAREVAPPPARGRPAYTVSIRADTPLIRVQAQSDNPTTALDTVNSVSDRLRAELLTAQTNQGVDAAATLDTPQPASVGPPVRTTGLKVFAATLVFGLLLAVMVAAAVERSAQRRRALLAEGEDDEPDADDADLPGVDEPDVDTADDRYGGDVAGRDADAGSADDEPTEVVPKTLDEPRSTLEVDSEAPTEVAVLAPVGVDAEPPHRPNSRLDPRRAAGRPGRPVVLPDAGRLGAPVRQLSPPPARGGRSVGLGAIGEPRAVPAGGPASRAAALSAAVDRTTAVSPDRRAALVPDRPAAPPGTPPGPLGPPGTSPGPLGPPATSSGPLGPPGTSPGPLGPPRTSQGPASRSADPADASRQVHPEPDGPSSVTELARSGSTGSDPLAVIHQLPLVNPFAALDTAVFDSSAMWAPADPLRADSGFPPATPLPAGGFDGEGSAHEPPERAVTALDGPLWPADLDELPLGDPFGGQSRPVDADPFEPVSGMAEQWTERADHDERWTDRPDRDDRWADRTDHHPEWDEPADQQRWAGAPEGWAARPVQEGDPHRDDIPAFEPPPTPQAPAEAHPTRQEPTEARPDRATGRRGGSAAASATDDEFGWPEFDDEDDAKVRSAAPADRAGTSDTADQAGPADQSGSPRSHETAAGY